MKCQTQLRLILRTFVESVTLMMIKTLLLAFICWASCAISYGQQPVLDSLLSAKSFFKLKDTLQSRQFRLSEKDSLYYYGYLHNFLNHSTASNEHILRLIKKFGRGLLIEQQIDLRKRCIDNYVKLYRYTDAYEQCEQLLNRYGKAMTLEDRADVMNSLVLWKSIRHLQPQRMEISNDVKIPYHRDLAGLLTIGINTKVDSTQRFVFDTGANLSVITETNAAKNGLELMKDSFDVTAITGLKIKARCALSRTLTIGDISLHNVVFMVFPDSALSFGTKYKIEGIIGFPVIEQLAEVRIYRNGFMEIPKTPVDDGINNLGLDELTPVINVGYAGVDLPFTFDTGGQETFLNLAFYKRFQEDIMKNGEVDYLRYGGAGGLDSVRSYTLKSVDLSVAGKAIRLNDVSVKTRAVSQKENIYYGNLGQDAVTRFEKVTINFKYMYLEF